VDTGLPVLLLHMFESQITSLSVSYQSFSFA